MAACHFHRRLCASLKVVLAQQPNAGAMPRVAHAPVDRRELASAEQPTSSAEPMACGNTLLSSETLATVESTNRRRMVSQMQFSPA